MAQKLRPDDVVRIKEMDSVRATVFFRDPDRPDPAFVKSRRCVAQEVRRAQQRLRTAKWRSAMDARKAPTAEQIGMAMCVALATSKLGELTTEDRQLVQAALHNLKANGFSIDEAKATMRRLRNRLVDPKDREGEPAESCGRPLLPSAWSGDEVEALF